MNEEINQLERRQGRRTNKINVILIIIIIILLLILFMLPNILNVLKPILPERWVSEMEKTFECVCPSCDDDDQGATGQGGINGSTTIEGTDLQVSFVASSIRIDTNSNFNKDLVRVNQNGSNINFNITLREPKDYATFYVTLTNNGNYDAEITGLETNILTNKEAQYIKYSITYADGKAIGVRRKRGEVITHGDILKKGETIELKFTALYRDDFATGLTEDLVVPFKSKIVFAQAD